MFALHRLLLRQYAAIVSKLEERHPASEIYCPHTRPTKTTFAYVGGSASAADACDIATPLLTQHGYDVRTVESPVDAHAFLWVNDSTIVDFTYKRLLADSRSTDGDCMYLHYCQRVLPPFFVGTPAHAQCMLRDVLTVHARAFPGHQSEPGHLSSLGDVWQRTRDTGQL